MAGKQQFRICVLTAAHLAMCPRMVKAARTLAEEGYDVRVVSARYHDWPDEIDGDLTRRGGFRWQRVDVGRSTAPLLHFASGGRYRAARVLVELGGVQRAPLFLLARAFGRHHSELLRAVLSERQDLIYAGTGLALATGAEAARRQGVPYALDLEDFHSAEQDDSPQSRLSHRLIERIEFEILPGAAFLTAASPAMAEAYARKYGLQPRVLNNTFPLPTRAPDFSSNGDRLRLYWFSQTLGAGRGLEDAVLAIGQAGIRCELHVRGVPRRGYMEQFREFVAEKAPNATLRHDLPAPDDPIDLARGHDVGLAVEDGHVFNRSICRTNKSFTYMLAGLAVVFTRTEGQADLADSLGEGAVSYTPGDIAALAAHLKRWAGDPAALRRAKEASWAAAQRRWRWDHPLERGALLDLVAKTLGGPASDAASS
ncbi:MAG TPA: glycosyltransferase [Terriglobales bacterium]|nr:glycosyltransferase [Terriglobales bacterium]